MKSQPSSPFSQEAESAEVSATSQNTTNGNRAVGGRAAAGGGVGGGKKTVNFFFKSLLKRILSYSIKHFKPS